MYIEVQLKQILHYSTLQVFITGCTFRHNKNSQLISAEYYDIGEGYGDIPTIIFLDTLFTFITLREDNYVMNTKMVTVLLHNVIINHVNAYNKSSIINARSDLHFQEYVEISACRAKHSAITAEYMYIDEYTVVNFTNNEMPFLLDKIGEYSGKDPAQILTPMMLLPCIFQYTSKRGKLDAKFQSGKKLNYTIFFISNNIERFSHYRYAITHCGWKQKAAFLHTRAGVINENVIRYVNDSLEHESFQKRICLCDHKNYDCFQENIGPFYPGQTVSLHFIIVFVPHIYETLLIKIEDGPETACSTTNRSVLTFLPFHVCTEIKYTIQHKSGKECDLYIKGVSHSSNGYTNGYTASPRIAVTDSFM